MNILAAIKREERKLEKQLGKLQKQLDGVRAAGKALGHLGALRDLPPARPYKGAVVPQEEPDELSVPRSP